MQSGPSAPTNRDHSLEKSSISRMCQGPTCWILLYFTKLKSRNLKHLPMFFSQAQEFSSSWPRSTNWRPPRGRTHHRLRTWHGASFRRTDIRPWQANGGRGSWGTRKSRLILLWANGDRSTAPCTDPLEVTVVDFCKLLNGCLNKSNPFKYIQIIQFPSPNFDPPP